MTTGALPVYIEEVPPHTAIIESWLTMCPHQPCTDWANPHIAMERYLHDVTFYTQEGHSTPHCMSHCHINVISVGKDQQMRAFRQTCTSGIAREGQNTKYLWHCNMPCKRSLSLMPRAILSSQSNVEASPLCCSGCPIWLQWWFTWCVAAP